MTGSDSRISLKIHKKKVVTKIGLPAEIRTEGRSVLNRVLSSHLDDEMLKVLEETINIAAIRFLEREGLSDINMKDMRAQRTYDQFLRKVCLHMDPESPIENKYLLDAVKTGKVDISDVASMTPILMHPTAWAKQYEDQLVEARVVAEGGVKKAATKILTCSQCLGKKVTFEEKQDRSADEAMTIHAECSDCAHKWTQ
jgi:DNA-directed RNA polymerase subunit M/transcription elongation factor TFIIS